MEYKVDTATDATATVQTVQPTCPSSVEDLTKRLAALKNAGVREYSDNGLHILFERPRQREEEDIVTRTIREYQEQLINGNG